MILVLGFIATAASFLDLLIQLDQRPLSFLHGLLAADLVSLSREAFLLVPVGDGLQLLLLVELRQFLGGGEVVGEGRAG